MARIADFDLGDELGEGSFGTVYKCTQRSTGLLFAVKVLVIRQVLRQKYGTQQVQTEKKALIALQDHPGVAKLRPFVAHIHVQYNHMRRYPASRK